MKKFLLIITGLFIITSVNAQVNNKVTVVKGELIRITPKLTDLKPDPTAANYNDIVRDKFGLISRRGVEPPEPAYYHDPTGLPLGIDPAIQKKYGPESRTNTNTPDLPAIVETQFNGMGFTGVSPADPTMCVGLNHVIQMINGSSGSYFRIYDKNGNPVIAQTYLDQLPGAGFFGSGDPIALYDQLANRYILSEFGSLTNGGSVNQLIMCISQTGDPTGAWVVYRFGTGTAFPDYPHWSIWNNAYYATTNTFDPGFVGCTMYAFDRTKMLASDPTATMQSVLRSEFTGANRSLAPVSLLGNTAPVGNSPGLFAYYNEDDLTPAPDVDSVGFLTFLPDFTTPANTVISRIPGMVVAPFKSNVCPDRNCAPGCNGSSGYDVLSNRIMHHAYLRRFPGYDAITLQHTVDAGGGQATTRWYEFRNSGIGWAVHQQSTYAPTASFRFMPSMATNALGQMCLAYNISGGGACASIGITGRNATDPLSMMTYDELVATVGTGYGTFGNRWGDYNDMNVDPAADSIFWFTAMYGETNWNTRILKIKLRPLVTCTPPVVTAPTVTQPTCGAPTGTIVVNATGTGTLEYSIGGPYQLSNTFTGLLGGSYNISARLVSDPVCNTSYSGNPVVIVPVTGCPCTPPTVNPPTVTQPSCAMPTGTIIVNATGPNVYEYSINNGTSYSSSPTFTGLTGGSYNIIVRVIGIPSCFAAYSGNPVVIVPVAGLPVGSASPQTICSAATTSVALNSTVGGTTYTWTAAIQTSPTGGTITGFSNCAAACGSTISQTLTNTGSSLGVVRYTVTPTAGICVGAPFTVDVTVNPRPNAVATPSSQNICSGSSINTIVITGNVTGTVYNWTRNNTATVTGIPATGAGNISGTLTNSTGASVTVTFTITPTANSCPGTPITATVTVNPTPTVDPVANQTVCNGAPSAPVTFTGGLPGTVYNWTNNTTSIGLAASGMGNIPSFIASNTTTIPVSATVTVTPSYSTVTQPVPELFHYTFNGTGATVPNMASAPPTGTAIATIVGAQTQGGSGTLCDGTLIGSGNSSTTDYVNTGWATNLTGTAWTMSFKTANIPSSTTLFYILGDNTAGSFRCFTNGVAGANNWMLRGPVGDIIVPGGATMAPHTTTFVYDVVAGQLRAYLDGVLVATNAQAPPTISGSGPFKVGAYATNTGLPTGGLMDEFRIYNRALSLSEVQSLANCATVCTGAPKTFTITVNPTPTITCPANITVPSVVGTCTATATYTPTVTGTPTPTLSYVLTGATTGSGSGTGSGTVAFRVGVTTVTLTATNTCATVSCSFNVTVTDSQLPVINTQPANRTVCAGSNATFSVAAVTAPSTGGSLNYQWQSWNGSAWVNILGATSSTYTVTSATVSQNTSSYRVQVIGLCTTVTSIHATLYVNPLPTINLTTSIPPALLPTQVLTITASTAPGGGTYVWRKNGTVIAGASGNTLSGLTVSDIGTYNCTYTDPNGCVSTSSDVLITGQTSGNLYVYPVPNNGIFIVRFYNQANEEVTIRIFDAKGAEVYNRKVQTTIPYTTINVDLSRSNTIASGVYTVEVRRADGKKAGSRKIIVEKK